MFTIHLLCEKCNKEMDFSNSRYLCNSCNRSYISHKNIFLIDGKLQKTGYQNKNLTMTTKEHFWYRYRHILIFDILKKNFKHPGKLKLLDMGCGDGNMINYLKNKGILKVVGCDIRIDSTTTSDLDIQFLQLDIRKKIIKKQQFDVILLLDVVEHVKDDTSLINLAKSLLKKNGILILTVPAPEYLYSDFDKFAGHYRRYNKKSLIKLMEGSKLKIKRISYFNSFILPFLLMRTTYYRLVKVQQEQVDEQNLNLHPLLNVALWDISRIEKKIINHLNMIIGSSLIAICSKE
jgi:2-polyprenyl-3-methyl-5-hydroxy-6-metoxy-1,4-benzoquinol methylase